LALGGRFRRKFGARLVNFILLQEVVLSWQPDNVQQLTVLCSQLCTLVLKLPHMLVLVELFLGKLILNWQKLILVDTVL
jgi:hypothetical protein